MAAVAPLSVSAGIELSCGSYVLQPRAAWSEGAVLEFPDRGADGQGAARSDVTLPSARRRGNGPGRASGTIRPLGPSAAKRFIYRPTLPICAFIRQLAHWPSTLAAIGFPRRRAFFADQTSVQFLRSRPRAVVRLLCSECPPVMSLSREMGQASARRHRRRLLSGDGRSFDCNRHTQGKGQPHRRPKGLRAARAKPRSQAFNPLLPSRPGSLR